MTQPFPMIERAVRELVEARYPAAAGKTGGDPSFDPASVGLFVEISLVYGQANEIDGEWTLDLDCYSRSYAGAMNHALGLEAALIGARRRTDVLRIDNVTQNQAPTERPWDDEGVYKVGATYVFTARRSG